jgi:hypothetical protein
MNAIKDIGYGISALITGIIALAVLSVVLSGSAQTSNVLAEFFKGLAALIQVTVSPVTNGGSGSSSSSNPLGSILGSGGFNPLSFLGGSSGSSSGGLNLDSILGGGSGGGGLGSFSSIIGGGGGGSSSLGGIESILGGL